MLSCFLLLDIIKGFKGLYSVTYYNCMRQFQYLPTCYAGQKINVNLHTLPSHVSFKCNLSVFYFNAFKNLAYTL